MTEYNNEQVMTPREKLAKTVSTCLGHLYGEADSDRAIRSQTILAVDSLCHIISKFYVSRSRDEVLSGEFNLDASYLDGIYDRPGRRVPLYFALDLMINVLEAKYMQQGDAKGTINILRSLRDDLATLSFDPKFEPKETMNQDTKDAIIKAKGEFTVKKMTKNGVSFVGVEPVLTQYDRERSITPLGELPMYERDAKEVRKIRREQMRRLYTITDRYFYPNQLDPIPTSEQFYDYLMDVDTDERIKEALRGISYLKDRYYHDDLLVEAAGKYMDRIEQVEKELQQQAEQQRAMEERNTAIANAKARYQEKSFLWRFFKRKMNPAKLDMESMNLEEINDLYTDTKKGKSK